MLVGEFFEEKSGKLCRAVIVRKVLVHMVLILDSLNLVGILLKRTWCQQ